MMYTGVIIEGSTFFELFERGLRHCTKIAFRLFLSELWEAAMVPNLVLLFLNNTRSGYIDASSHSSGDHRRKYTKRDRIK